jgi:hypothetical protein
MHTLTDCVVLEGVTKDEMQIFETLFYGESTSFGPLTIEKCFENPLHLLFNLPKSSFGEHKVTSNKMIACSM